MNNTDHVAFIFHVNREDLLQKAVQSARDLQPELIIIDNSADGIIDKPQSAIMRPSVPLSASQSINFALRYAKKNGYRICVIMHNDAQAHPDSCRKLVNTAQRMTAEGRKWGVLFTNYDSLAALNVELVDVVGLWDTNLPQYFTDNDYYRRVRLADYECIDTGLFVDHVGSQTVNSDPELRAINAVTFPLYQAYYAAKWGGAPGQETFERPFNRLDSANL